MLTKSKIFARLWLLLLIVFYALFSYNFFNGWWYAFVGTALIVLFSALYYKKNFVQIIGLNLTVRTVVQSLILAIVVVAGAWIVMKYVAAKRGIAIEYSDWGCYFHTVFYTLNEEIVLGGILLYALTRKWKMKPMMASVLLAVFFSLVHYVFYRWIFIDRGIIEVSTLVTLFFIGIVRNNIILYTGHIGYSWALHFGWMAVMFGSWHRYAATEKYLGELIRFNIYLGSVEMLILSSLMLLLSCYFWSRKNFEIKLL
ncbi:MAG TPA: hypothetical protein VHO72_17995 [Bacteroidales bacterium]|nr:hypothetical protein [Bacteroidales bacterium]